MNKNVGLADKRVRTAIGAVLGIVSLATVAGSLALPSVAALVLGVASLIMLGTAVTGTCPVYSLLGVDTCPVSAGESR